MDLYSRVQGGKLAVNAKSGAKYEGALAGTFDVSDFSLINEPAMQEVVSSTSGPGGAPNGINPSRLHFDRATVRFRMTDQGITIDDGLLRSPVVGATFNGRYDFSSTSVVVNGTYIPAYAINNAFSRIPLIGLVLTGGFKEGLIGVTFKVEGPIASPRIYINPLSAVAPGIFRKIFEFH